MTTAYIFSTLPAAQACAVPVDSHMGYPRPGLDIGSGTHSTPTQSITQTYVSVITNPTLPSWAYPIDNNVTFIVGPNAISLNLPAPSVLDSTWTPSISVSAQVTLGDINGK